MKLLACVASALVGFGAAGPQGSWRLDDFEDGDRVAASGVSWGVISDALQGGATRVGVLPVAGGAGGSKRALRVAGKIAEKGFAGAWVALDGSGRSVDASAFAGIRLRAKGAGSLLIGLRGGPLPGGNFMARREVGADWSLLDVPFDALQPQTPGSAFDAKDVRWLGIQAASGRSGEVAFEIDDVELYGAARADAKPIVTEGPAFTMRAKAGSLSELPKNAAWRELARDAAGDGTRATLPDATALSVLEDAKRGIVWFRVGLAQPPESEAFGVNLAFDLDGRPDNGFAWWGANKTFRFDRLVTAFVHLRDGDVYQGVLGVADADQVARQQTAEARFPAPRVIVDRAGSALIVGVPKAVLEGAKDVSLLAAVGSAFAHNDDVPDGAPARLAR